MAATYDFSKLEYVDDRSPFINYTGSWTLLSNSGSFDDTVHSTTEIGASASFWFRGSYIFIAITLPACPNRQNHTGTRLQYYLSGVAEDGPTSTVCSQAGVVNGFDAYRMPVSGDPSILHEVRVTNMGSDPAFPLILDRFAYLPLEGSLSSMAFGIPSTTRSTPLTTTFTTSLGPTIVSSRASTTTLQLISGPSDVSPVHTSTTTTPLTSDINTDFQPSVSPLTRTIIGTCISLAAIFLLGGLSICFLRRRARSRISNALEAKPENPFDDAYGQPNFLSTTHPHFFHQNTLSSSTTQLPPHQNGENTTLLNATRRPSVLRPRSPNSLFDNSRSSTPSGQCIIGQKTEFSRCFCPSCDDRALNTPRRKYRASSAMRSIVPSIASSNATAAPAYARYRASIDVRSVQSNPLSEVLPAYDALHSIDETSSLTSPPSRTTVINHPSWHSSVPSLESSTHSFTASSSSFSDSPSNPFHGQLQS